MLNPEGVYGVMLPSGWAARARRDPVSPPPTALEVLAAIADLDAEELRGYLTAEVERRRSRVAAQST